MADHDQRREERFHHRPVDDAVQRVDAAPDSGLSDNEARARLERHGPNEVGGGGGPSRLRMLAQQFTEALVLVLIVAAAVSGFLLQEWVEAGVILGIVVLNGALGYVQESRAEQSLVRLREMTAPRARVLRDGRDQEIPAREVVRGDILVLEPGDRVAADARVLRAQRLAVDEAALTGESFEVIKAPEPVDESATLADQTSMVFMGTAVGGGRGRAVVTATGGATEMGAIAALLRRGRGETPLQRDLDRLGKRLTALAVGIAVVLFVAGILRGFDTEQVFLTVVALAVAAIPEGLPAVVTVALARGVHRMADRGAIVRRLPAVETLGSVDVIASDKTRTLTQGRIRVVQLVTLDGVQELDELLPEDPRVQRFALVAALCNQAQRDGEDLTGDSTDIAMLMAAEDLGADLDELRANHPRRAVVPFDGERKRMTTVNEDDGRLLLLVKGAPEVLLQRSSQVETSQGPSEIDRDALERLAAEGDACAAQGLRVLAAAYRSLDSEPDDIDGAEHDLVFVALAAMRDDIREEVPAAIEEITHAGARVVMVTGDHPSTAEAIAERLGLLGEGREIRHGRELRERSAEELASDIDRVGAYARVEPRDKLAIIEAWRLRGATVAMTGDGVNDAPALQAADIGVAMGSGTEVAKDAADMVLTDDNFATIVAAVREGRRIFENLAKTVHFLVSTNLAEIVVVAMGVLVFGRGEPLLATQLLWINLITDGLPVLALAVDPPAPDLMDRAPIRRRDLLGRRQLLRLSADGAVLAGVALFAMAYSAYIIDGADERTQTLTFTTLALVQFAQLINIRAGALSPLRVGVGGNRLLLGTLVASVTLQVIVVQTAVGEVLFDTVPLGVGDWALAAGLVGVAFVGLLGLRGRLGPTSHQATSSRGG